ncbi:hypothetical protein J6590_067289 [Homalodisca vitripennis]|nr:hypothetical protein J6590_067289 [Homalodisca vitripennis]
MPCHQSTGSGTYTRYVDVSPSQSRYLVMCHLSVLYRLCNLHYDSSTTNGVSYMCRGTYTRYVDVSPSQSRYLVVCHLSVLYRLCNLHYDSSTTNGVSYMCECVSDVELGGEEYSHATGRGTYTRYVDVSPSQSRYLVVCHLSVLYRL